MANAEIIVDERRAIIALGKFSLSLQQNQELMQELGNAQLVSIRRTFRDEGSPAASWVPLAPSTLKQKSAGDKMLVRSGRLLNSIGVDAQPGSVTISTSLVYAAVHQFGSRDRGGVAIGPVTKAASESTVDVKGGSYLRVSSELGTGKLAGRNRRIQGPRGAKTITRRAGSRHQNIPARPYVVFRPEDPDRLRLVAVNYVNRQANAAGLQVTP